MCTALTRAALMCASIALTVLPSVPANAELPRLHRVVTLRPLPSEHVRELESGFPIFSGFGAAVAIRNGTAFVGVTRGFPDSRVGVYGQTASGWVRTATLTVPDALIFGWNGFGRAMVFRDGVAVIASYTFLHVFRRVNGVWTAVQKLAPPDGGPGAFWEISAMRFENGILVVSSSSGPFPSPERVVYLYELASNGKLAQRATLRGFGGDVAVAGNLIVVGASDAAYVFRRRTDGAWVQTQKLIGADSSPIGGFGGAVAIDQGMIIVGAPSHECLESDVSFGGFCDRSGGGTRGPDGIGAGGAAYGFVPIGGQYVQVFKLRPRADEHANYFQFGRRIAMMGNYIVIDAAEQSAGGDGIFEPFSIENGVSFIYRRDGSTVTARGMTDGYVASDSIGLANNWLMVGTAHDNQHNCQTELEFCFGEANIFDLNRFEQ
jgi:hypothetical protein